MTELCATIFLAWRFTVIPSARASTDKVKSTASAAATTQVTLPTGPSPSIKSFNTSRPRQRPYNQPFPAPRDPRERKHPRGVGDRTHPSTRPPPPPGAAFGKMSLLALTMTNFAIVCPWHHRSGTEPNALTGIEGKRLAGLKFCTWSRGRNWRPQPRRI